jgi:sec-independent protein translocase protein TatC
MPAKKKSSPGSKKKATQKNKIPPPTNLTKTVSPPQAPSPVTKLEEESIEYNPREKYMTLGEHLEELRWVLIKSIITVFAIMIGSLFFGSEIHTIFVKPYKNVLGSDATFFQIKLMAPVFIYLKTSFMVSILFGFPFVFYFLWNFVSPALDPTTDKYGKFIILFSTLLFWGGVLVCWFTVFENLLEIFLVIFRPPDVDMKLPIDEYYDIFFNIHLVFGTSFQLPIVLILLGRLGILKSAFLINRWREATIIISVFSAFFSPGPDVFSMMMLFIPLMILFFASLIIMVISEKKDEEIQS